MATYPQTELETRYYQLINAVATKHPEETRFDTALRYIQEAEQAVSKSAIIQEVEKEVRMNRATWRDHDDLLSPQDWHGMIADYNAWARRKATQSQYEKARNRYIQVAALAIAAVEAIDRQYITVQGSAEQSPGTEE